MMMRMTTGRIRIGFTVVGLAVVASGVAIRVANSGLRGSIAVSKPIMVLPQDGLVPQFFYSPDPQSCPACILAYAPQCRERNIPRMRLLNGEAYDI